MEDQKQTSYTFEIDNFSEKEAVLSSPALSIGGCEWYVVVYPKGDVHIIDDHMSLYLCVANPESLRLGWKRQAKFSFVLLNQSGKELFRTAESCNLFCSQISRWGGALLLETLQEKGFLEKNKLILKVEVKVVEVVDQGVVTGNETFNFNGFQVPYSQLHSVRRLFMQHPDFALNFRLNSQLVKTAYMNLLLGLIEILNKPPHSLSEVELSTARIELIELTEAGFKLDWLKTKLAEVTLERKKSNSDGCQVQELEEHIKNLKVELNEEKLKTDTSAAKVLSLEQTVSDLKDDVLELEDEVWDLKDELNKEKGKAATSAANVLSLEQTVSDLKDEVSDLKGVVCTWEVFDYADLRNEK
ncbi:unnamed protein product [Microthlaspi erraticum]|uniref:MATH domain-containing protein n=1 Tax=Microthlaspi erraticum TaxID=1685480 RepID=A0A6D2JLK9_9BRAS|nr:unnamed protein product [Microthlaspi erraticum]CAA7040666.1 unnamed protein product [Microthlaspi erraticum]